MVKPRHPKEVAYEATAIDGIMPIEKTKLPARILEELHNAGIHTIEQLQYLSDDELYQALRDVGSRAVDRVRETLMSGQATIHDPNE